MTAVPFSFSWTCLPFGKIPPIPPPHPPHWKKLLLKDTCTAFLSHTSIFSFFVWGSFYLFCLGKKHFVLFVSINCGLSLYVAEHLIRSNLLSADRNQGFIDLPPSQNIHTIRSSWGWSHEQEYNCKSTIGKCITIILLCLFIKSM